jgi:hypothetical protein
MRVVACFVVVGALALSPAAFAQATPTTKADCVKAKMKWNAKGGADKKGACVAAAPKSDKK